MLDVKTLAATGPSGSMRTNRKWLPFAQDSLLAPPDFGAFKKTSVDEQLPSPPASRRLSTANVRGL